MTTTDKITGSTYAKMIAGGAANLRAHVQEVNDLNVFPIPDGDTGENMLLTILGGVSNGDASPENLGEAAERVSEGMLLSARGNSGVILSQFFDGIARGFGGLYEADAKHFGIAFRYGVDHAYKSVMTPTEGTILTVLREATEVACKSGTESVSEFLTAFLREARASLARTPELLDVLKKAGVVDSGGAGLCYIVDGMSRALSGEKMETDIPVSQSTQEIDYDAFDEDSVLKFGYCTELLLRLQNAKTNIDTFETDVITDYLSSIGDSIVAVQNGSIVKIHVHTMTPDMVLSFCQQYGEFLKIKIENMSLQHNSIPASKKKNEAPTERKAFGVVAVASGVGLVNTFIERGADVVVSGGQSMNPSAEDFIEAFDKVGADTIFVLPNNGNIVLTAKQAAELYRSSDVRVIESKTIGDGYAALSMLDTDSGDADRIAEELTEAMQGVVTAEVSHCVRDANMDGTELHAGDYIGFVGKTLLASNESRLAAVCETLDKLDFSHYDFCILIRGKDTNEAETERIEAYVSARYKNKEIYIIDGAQEVYDYILILQ